MPAAYDTYDYPSYWVGREYEHRCELIAVKALLQKIPRIDTLIEVGAGFGRITPVYKYRAKKIFLTDPSGKLLSLARDSFKRKGLYFVHSRLERLDKKIKRRSADLIIMVRVLHHIKDVDQAFKILSKLTKKGGYLILEFANKSNFKNMVKEFLRGNFVFPMEIDTVDKRSKKNIKKNTIPFNNYHVDYIKDRLSEAGYKIIEKRSVSNIRNSFVKNLFPTSFFLSLANLVQPLLGYINFGPSIFILAKKIEE